MPVVRDARGLRPQLRQSRSSALVFNNRLAVMVVCALVTCCSALAATRLALNASFEKMIPQSHPYIQNYLENRSELRGLGNALRIVVENTERRHLRPAATSTRCKQDPRRALPDAGRRPRLGEVAVGARRCAGPR